MNKHLTLLALLAVIWTTVSAPAKAAENSDSPTNSIDLGLDPSARRQTFDGWGVSLCWWANMLGKWDETNMQEIVRLVVDPQQGLGYNIFRYNIGGGDNPEHHHIIERAALEGYRPAPDKPYDWNADATQRRVLCEIQHRNPNVIVEAFANSPPWWMTVSGCCSGGTNGSDNLKPEHFNDFADYLTEVVLHFRNDWKIQFRTIEPFNEPDGNWWKAYDKKQEGCYVSPEHQATVISAVAAMLEKKHLTNVVISASDWNSVAAGLKTLKTFDAKTLETIGQLNVHTYNGRSARADFAQFATAHNKPVWMSETGPMDWPGGNQMDVSIWLANLIIHDIHGLGARAWVDWQLIDGGIWGTIHANWKAQTWSLTKRFYMHAQFSRFIKPGAQIIESENENALAAVNPSGDLSIVLVNTSKSNPRRWSLDLTCFGTKPATAHIFRTSPREDLTPQPDLSATNGCLQIDTPPYSITTANIHF